MEYVNSSTKNSAVSAKKYLESSVGVQRRMKSGNNLEGTIIFCGQARVGPGSYR